MYIRFIRFLILLRCDPNFLRISEKPELDEADETDDEPDIDPYSGRLVGLDSMEVVTAAAAAPNSDDGFVAAKEDTADDEVPLIVEFEW